MYSWRRTSLLRKPWQKSRVKSWRGFKGTELAGNVSDVRDMLALIERNIYSPHYADDYRAWRTAARRLDIYKAPFLRP
jgi:hypothetical protein